MSLKIAARCYQIEEKAFASDPKFIIFNEQGHCDFVVKSTLLALGDKLSMFDAHGNELFKIRQQLVFFRLTFNISKADNSTELASIQRRGMPWNYRLEVTSSMFGNYQMNWLHGVFNQEFVLMKQEKLVARINHKRKFLAHTYSVEIEKGVAEGDIPFILSVVIVLWCAHRYRGAFVQISN